MNNQVFGALSGFSLIVVIFLVVLAILWFLLPFAIFGMKGKLDSLISEVRKSNAELKRLREALTSASRDSSHTLSSPPQKSALSHDQIMAKFGISNDGENYIFQGKRFQSLQDAAAHALKKSSQ